MKIVKNGQLVDFSFPVVVPEFSGATDNSDGEKGSVPAPKITDKNKFLKGDGTWGYPADTKYDNATASKSGLMSNTDKSKLDGIAEGANKTLVDIVLNSNSTNPVQNKVIKGELDKKAPISNANLTGIPTVPTASNGVNNAQIASTAFVHSVVNEKIAAADAMIFKGTLGTGGTITTLPASHKTGWTYKVIVAGTYAGQKCEIGDLVVCLVDGTAAKDSDWTVVQTNVDGVVTGPTSSVANRVAVFDGATGKVIKDSGFTIASNVPANAKFTDTTYANATTTKAGLMSNADKVKLNGINITSGTQDLQAGVSPLANGTIYLVYE